MLFLLFIKHPQCSNYSNPFWNGKWEWMKRVERRNDGSSWSGKVHDINQLKAMY